MKIIFPARIIFAIFILLSACHVAADEYCDWKQDTSDGKNAIMQALCGLAGDAGRGRVVAIDRAQGNCLSCHGLPAPEEDFHGQIGPPLYGVAMRYTEGELRMRLVDAAVINPATIMPGFYRDPDDNYRMAEQYTGKTMLSAQQVEDLVAYLLSLKTYP